MRTRTTTARAAVAVLAAAAGGLALAACSSATHSPGRSSALPAGRSSSAPASSTVPPTSSSAGSSGSSSAATTTCTTAELAGSLAGEQGGAGTLELTVALRNSGTATCTMEGYAGLQLLGSGGTQLSTDTQQGGSLSFESVAPSLVTLAPGQSAYFNVGFSDVPSAGESSCPTATDLQVVPPGATALTVPVQIQACGGGLDESAVFGATSPATQTTAPAGGA